MNNSSISVGFTGKGTPFITLSTLPANRQEMCVEPLRMSNRKIDVQISEEVARLHLAEQRRKQIAALSMVGTPPPRHKNSWLKHVGKYSEDSPLVRILDAGAKIRESQRKKQC